MPDVLSREGGERRVRVYAGYRWEFATAQRYLAARHVYGMYFAENSAPGYFKKEFINLEVEGAEQSRR